MHDDANGGGGRAASPGPARDVEQPGFLALERELTVLLRRARASQGEMAREVHPDLEPSAYGLLVRLDECGRQRATELAAYIGVGKATMSRQLRALEQLGLLAREPDPADGRAWLVALTEEGQQRVSRVREARRARYAGRLADWDPAEVTELARLLNQLNRSMAR
ncbi:MULTISPECIES: MarR family winged helix-turn-helix transcriptional regulator [unclassified Streptomyces]|uniref:MarR family winged helix-turn-helix transcriptional regulator n=1 Tax=unclassified Streptomyces TaxID=2593676 RepID=UPI000AFF9AEA|nr:MULTISPECIES: MarR family transcriptional regulator [unclassified Streptomyces]AZM60057.1 MarR family transcriptional regulator [Streptomyces sp. WAC 01438]RSM99818.1 MarR family transcriptional regulator [Streptomyces sp. WAC 01420]